MVRLSKAVRPLPPSAPVWHVSVRKVLAVTALALTTANCAGPQSQKMAAAGGGSGIDPKYGVKASPRLYNEGDVIPKGGGRRFSGKPYVVAGRTYVPREDAKGYVREGLASWYGSAFHGRLTANGEVFDRMSVAAAHPTMPLPSYARVTNLANGYSMVVRVNDRGPYHADRLMDVSEEVAQALDFRRRGTARVRVEYVGKASTAGSDDAKLMATLRTDGEPASVRGRSPVMLADLGPDASDTLARTLAKPQRTALAFRSAADEDEPAPRPVRAAPSVVAAAPSIAVPHAVQPTTRRTASFVPTRPSPIAPASRTTRAAQAPAPLSLAPPPIRLAGARHDVAPAHRLPASPVRVAASPPTIPAAKDAVAPSLDRRPATVPSRVATLAPPGPPALKPTAGRMVIPPVKPALLAGAKFAGSDGRVPSAAKPVLADPRSTVAKPAAHAVKPSRRAQFARVE
ncbi:septal ring lytic transglycosylase RlpA family protein [uncultured Methylobacterium sp.]|uniref:septal ring lytic transglycosylase RlpA family protein n=1 Tax=uncultured Methylobacterium sp. TaxID=157278 RepID=UPI0035C98B2D